MKEQNRFRVGPPQLHTMQPDYDFHVSKYINGDVLISMCYSSSSLFVEVKCRQ